MTIKARVTTASNAKAYLEEYERNARRLVGLVAQDVRGAAIDAVTQGSPAGIVYTRADTEANKGRAKTHRASAPGQPPASDTGVLAESIAVETGPTGLTATVESRAEYSEHLEHGTDNIAPRPFMRPAAEVGRRNARRRRRVVKAGSVRATTRRRAT